MLTKNIVNDLRPSTVWHNPMCYSTLHPMFDVHTANSMPDNKYPLIRALGWKDLEFGVELLLEDTASETVTSNKYSKYFVEWVSITLCSPINHLTRRSAMVTQNNKMAYRRV